MAQRHLDSYLAPPPVEGYWSSFSAAMIAASCIATSTCDDSTESGEVLLFVVASPSPAPLAQARGSLGFCHNQDFLPQPRSQRATGNHAHSTARRHKCIDAPTRPFIPRHFPEFLCSQVVYRICTRRASQSSPASPLAGQRSTEASFGSNTQVCRTPRSAPPASDWNGGHSPTGKRLELWPLGSSRGPKRQARYPYPDLTHG